MFTVTRLRETSQTNVTTGAVTVTWTTETSDGWLMDWRTGRGSTFTTEGDRLVPLETPRLLRLGIDFPDIIEGDRLAYSGPGGVADGFDTDPESPDFNPDDPLLFTTDGRVARWSDGAFGGIEVPVRRVS